MRPAFLSAALALGLLAGCQLALPGSSGDATPTAQAGAGATETIEVTPLAPAGAEPAPEAVAEAAPSTAPEGPKMAESALASETGAAPAVEPEKIEAAAKPAEAEPEAAPEAAAAPPEVPEELKSASQIACEKKGGRYARAGNDSTFVCVRQTRDGGKRCKKESDCQGVCLARSGTCSPFTPVLGCQEILTESGTRVTECVE
jgi:hypothetical protein